MNLKPLPLLTIQTKTTIHRKLLGLLRLAPLSLPLAKLRAPWRRLNPFGFNIVSEFRSQTHRMPPRRQWPSQPQQLLPTSGAMAGCQLVREKFENSTRLSGGSRRQMTSRMPKHWKVYHTLKGNFIGSMIWWTHFFWSTHRFWTKLESFWDEDCQIGPRAIHQTTRWQTWTLIWRNLCRFWAHS